MNRQIVAIPLLRFDAIPARMATVKVEVHHRHSLWSASLDAQTESERDGTTVATTSDSRKWAISL
jgi:hypothetical protein